VQYMDVWSHVVNVTSMTSSSIQVDLLKYALSEIYLIQIQQMIHIRKSLELCFDQMMAS